MIAKGTLAAEGTASIKLSVQLDGAQYKLDMMHLAVQDSMFVEESYAACHAAIKMPTSCSSIAQLKALIQLAQQTAEGTEIPKWLERSFLGQNQMLQSEEESKTQ